MRLRTRLALVIAIAAGIFAGGFFLGRYDFPSADSLRAKDEAVCFVPQQDCTQFVVDAIEGAQKQILVQAYNFTTPRILEALAKAKEERKLDVRAILDKSNEQPRYTGGTYVHNHGIPVLIDSHPDIAHSKIMIFDGKDVLTGSFNFTEHAQKRNAENILLEKNDPWLASSYIDNWHSREAKSHEFVPGSAKTTGRRSRSSE